LKVPFNDLERQYAAIKHQIDTALDQAFHEFHFIRGTAVATFEKSFSRMLNVGHCIATANGTDSLFLILKAYGIKPGDEIITPAFSWISSAEVISLAGATPVFADIDSRFYTIDVEDVERKITPKTKAVVAVHLFGQAAPVLELKEICRRHGILLIEDCAQAHLTAECGQYVGTFGDAAAFSFYPTKNLGAYGDAGAVVTDDSTLAEKIRRLANHGALQKDDHLFEGMNSRMDTIQAAVLSAKIPHLPRWNAIRQENAERYRERLMNVGDLILPAIRENTSHTFHLFVVRLKRRDALRAFLLEKDVQTIVHYPAALHNLPAYEHLGCEPQSLKVSNTLQHEVISLPVFPELSLDQIDYVCENIKEFFQM
jgi:dTDP-4-amino-4,6-dideoxygalactose transaminase